MSIETCREKRPVSLYYLKDLLAQQMSENWGQFTHAFIRVPHAVARPCLRPTMCGADGRTAVRAF